MTTLQLNFRFIFSVLVTRPIPAITRPTSANFVAYFWEASSAEPRERNSPWSLDGLFRTSMKCRKKKKEKNARTCFLKPPFLYMVVGPSFDLSHAFNSKKCWYIQVIILKNDFVYEWKALIYGFFKNKIGLYIKKYF